MINEFKPKVPECPLPYYVYAQQTYTIPASTWQIVRTGTFSSEVDWSKIFIKVLFQNYTAAAVCEVNIVPTNNTTFRIYIRENRGVGTNGICRAMVLLDRNVTLTLS